MTALGIGALCVGVFGALYFAGQLVGALMVVRSGSPPHQKLPTGLALVNWTFVGVWLALLVGLLLWSRYGFETAILVIGPIGLGYMLFEAVVSLTWSQEKTARLRRGPTYSPKEALWMLASSLFLAALLLGALL